MSCKTPAEFREKKEKVWMIYLEQVVTQKFDCPLKELELKKKHACVIGPTSVGKSTLLNKLFGLKLKTDLGACTMEATMVKETADTVFWDAPGINADFGFYNP